MGVGVMLSATAPESNTQLGTRRELLAAWRGGGKEPGDRILFLVGGLERTSNCWEAYLRSALLSVHGCKLGRSLMKLVAQSMRETRALSATGIV